MRKTIILVVMWFILSIGIVGNGDCMVETPMSVYIVYSILTVACTICMWRIKTKNEKEEERAAAAEVAVRRKERQAEAEREELELQSLERLFME
jgi:hypothetical protein